MTVVTKKRMLSLLTAVLIALAAVCPAFAAATGADGIAPSGEQANGLEASAQAEAGQAAPLADGVLEPEYLTLAPGADETQLNFAWYSANPTASLVIREQDDPEWTTYTTTDELTSNSGLYSHKVSAVDLSPDTSYVYKIVEDSGESEEYEVQTGNPDAFSFFAVGDPQLGQLANIMLQSDIRGWTETLDTATAMFPNASFLISAGDQVETSNSERQYAGYFSPDALKSLPTAQALGNHDTNAIFDEHFNHPNTTEYGMQSDSYAGDFWYRYGATLIMHLNSNYASIGSHQLFMEEAIAQNQDATWKIVVFHHSLYTEAYHSGDSYQVGDSSRRLTWVPVFDELGIDVVLAGHDHSYTRTHQMLGNEPQTEQTWLNDDHTAVVNPTGTVYFELNSGSGSKYYSLKSTDFFFSAARHQANKPSFSVIDMTDDTFSITTYRTDTMEAVDSYTIVKTDDELDGDKLIVAAETKTVRQGDSFGVDVGFAEPVASNTAILQVEYDADLFEVTGLEPADGVTLINLETEEQGGSTLLTVMVPDYDTQVYGRITFTAHEDAELSNTLNPIRVEAEYVVLEESGEKVIKTASGDTSVYTSGGGNENPGLGDEVTLIDLSNIIDMFGYDDSMEDWNAKYRPYDINDNGVIDIYDIAYFAQKVNR